MFNYNGCIISCKRHKNHLTLSNSFKVNVLKN